MMRAQAWSFDFMASVVVFFVILTVLFFAWEYVTFQNEDQMIFNDMENQALILADSLIRNKGFPEDWNETSVSVIGLAESENVLDENKILTFVQMDYDIAKTKLGVPAYEFLFRVRYLNDTQAQSGGVDLILGIDPTGILNTTMVVPVERYVLFDHRVAKLSFILWR
jgi:hypothetical protein